MRKKRLILLGLVLLIAIILGAGVLYAQSDEQDCPAFVYDAIELVGDYCSALERNSACYGHNQVMASFADEVPSDYFAAPADRAALSDLELIQTSPLDPQAGYWGLSLLNVQANIPDTIPGQATIFMLMGDVELQNEVPAEGEQTSVAEGHWLTINDRANLRIFPASHATVVGSIPAQTAVYVDSISPDGQWIGVVHEDQRYWMTSAVAQNAPELATLPVLNPAHASPMQAFYFKTGLGNAGCDDASNSLVIQGPNQVAVDIQANGAYIRIGSTILLRIVDGNLMQLVTLSGTAYADGVIVPAGFTVYAPLDANGRVAGPFGGLHGVSCNEMTAMTLVQSVPASLLHYGITLPLCGQVIQVQQPATNPNIVTGYIYVPPAPAVSLPASSGISIPSIMPVNPGGGSGGGAGSGGNSGGNGNNGGNGCNGNGNCNGNANGSGNCNGNGNPHCHGNGGHGDDD